jgi:RHS repeat-associated protein
VGEVRYRPYGERRPGYPLGAMVTDRLYTGQRWEASLGLYDYRARFYDPVLGRFIQPDPLVPKPGNPQALNRYAYVYHNPLRYTDPTGHCPWCIALAIGIVFVGALLYPDIAYAPDLSADLSRLPPASPTPSSASWPPTSPASIRPMIWRP